MSESRAAFRGRHGEKALDCIGLLLLLRLFLLQNALLGLGTNLRIGGRNRKQGQQRDCEQELHSYMDSVAFAGINNSRSSNACSSC